MSLLCKLKEKGGRRFICVRCFLFICTIILVYKAFFLRLHTEAEEKLLPDSERRVYVVPFLRGQGLNNQLWEYRTSAIIARATQRSLCIVPFHRFYLERKGREFLPFQEIFSTESLKDYVASVSNVNNCVAACSNTLQRVIELVNKPPSMNMEKPYPIADERPGSLNKFKRSTMFSHIPKPTMLNINVNRKGVHFDSLLNISRALSAYSADPCIAIAGIATDVRDEFTLWNKHLVVSSRIQKITHEVKKKKFSNERYLSIHWRFEESKCAGFGIGIGNGRDVNLTPAKLEGKYITRTSKDANICFYGGKVPPKRLDKTWIRLLHKDDIVSWIRETMKKYNLNKVYLATDCKDAELLEWIKSRTGAITVSDLKEIIRNNSFAEDNDVISRIEQELCAEAHIFAGTQKSSWSIRVVEERSARTKNKDLFNDLFYRGHISAKISVYFDEVICKKKSLCNQLQIVT